MEQSVDVLSLKDVQLDFLFFVLGLALVILNDRLCQMYLFFSAKVFLLLNEFVLTRLIK